MKKLLLALPALLLVWAGTVYLRARPTTTLVDAAGGSLTQSSAPAEETLGLYAPVDAALETEELERAKALLVELLQTAESDGETCTRLARVCSELEQDDEAVDYGLKATQLLPESGAAHHAYAQALALKMMRGKSKLAAMALMPRWKEELAKAIELDPSNAEAREEQLAFKTFVPSFLGGDPEEALELAGELEQVAPAKGRVWRLRVLAKLDRHDEAIALARDLCAEDPEDAMLPYTLGTLLAETEDAEGARAAFHDAQAHAGSEGAYRALEAEASLLLERGEDLETAVALLDRYLVDTPKATMMPPRAMVLLHRGEALEELGRRDEALAAYRAALAEEPRLEAAAEAIEELGG